MTAPDETLNQAKEIVMRERDIASQNPKHLVSRESMSSVSSLYSRLGCESDTHNDRDSFDRCLSAKLYLDSLKGIAM